MTYPGLGKRFQPREFSQQHHNIMLDLRSRIITACNRPSAKLRLGYFELLMLAFAVRVGRGRSQRKKTAILEKRLNKYARRAKRSFISRYGADAYDALMLEWKSSRNWLRFNVLPLRVPRHPLLRQFFKQQKLRFMEMARAALQSRCVHPLPESRLQWVVTLALRQLRRRPKQGPTVRGLIANPEQGQDFLFAFIQKRCPELEVRFDYLEEVEQAAVRDKQLAAALTIPEIPAELRVELESISQKKVVQRIARFFSAEVFPKDWERVAQQTQYLIDRGVEVRPARMNADSLDGVFAAAKPPYEPLDGPDQLNHAAEWLLAFLGAINAYGQRAADLVQNGWVRAMAG